MRRKRHYKNWEATLLDIKAQPLEIRKDGSMHIKKLQLRYKPIKIILKALSDKLNLFKLI